MNVEDTVSGLGGDRLRFEKYKGQAIFVIDFSECSNKEILLLLDQVKSSVERHAPASLLILSDFSGTKIDKQVATRAKEVLVLDRPYVKKSAWLGTESIPRVFYDNFKNFSQRELPTFKSREDALEWLVSE